MVGERLLRRGGVVAGGEAHADHRPGPREPHVGRLGDARRVDAEHGDRGFEPHPLHDAARTEELDAGQERDVAAERGLVDVRRGRRAAHQPRHRDLAVLVVQAGQRAAERGERVADRAAEDAGVCRALQHRHLDDHVDEAAERGVSAGRQSTG